jgi:SpoIID/LytB domain protein
VVLLRDGGGLVDVRYSASCGGHTEDNDAIWGGEPDPSLRGRADSPQAASTRITDATLEGFLAEDPRDAWCGRTHRARGKFRWNERLPVDELSARIADEYPALGRLTAMSAKQRGSSGRIEVLELTGQHGSAEVTGDLHIRRLLGGLKSTLFAIAHDGDAFVLRGAGYGHGVGMCQEGAIGMADAGKTYEQILAHYFRGTPVHKLY